jgi:hypothetical protein
VTDEADETPLYTETVEATGQDPEKYWEQIAAEVRAIREQFYRALELPTPESSSVKEQS